MKCNRCGKENPGDIHTCSPLALKLADDLDQWLITSAATRKSAAAELRRLHDEVELQQLSLNTARQMIESYVEHIGKLEAALRRVIRLYMVADDAWDPDAELERFYQREMKT